MFCHECSRFMHLLSKCLLSIIVCECNLHPQMRFPRVPFSFVYVWGQVRTGQWQTEDLGPNRRYFSDVDAVRATRGDDRLAKASIPRSSKTPSGVRLCRFCEYAFTGESLLVLVDSPALWCRAVCSQAWLGRKGKGLSGYFPLVVMLFGYILIRENSLRYDSFHVGMF